MTHCHIQEYFRLTVAAMLAVQLLNTPDTDAYFEKRDHGMRYMSRGHTTANIMMTSTCGIKHVYTSRFVRVILAQGPCYYSLYRSNFKRMIPEGNPQAS